MGYEYDYKYEYKYESSRRWKEMTEIKDKIRSKNVLDSEIIKDIKYMDDPVFFVEQYRWCDWPLFMWVIYGKRKELAEYLLTTYPTYININHNYQNTPLHLLCDEEDKDTIYILKLLLSREDLDVNIQIHHGNGWTCLHEACHYGNVKPAIELLLDARIDSSIRDNDGRTARDTAESRGQLGIANVLKMVQYTSILRIPNELLIHDIVRMLISTIL